MSTTSQPPPSLVVQQQVSNKINVLMPAVWFESFHALIAVLKMQTENQCTLYPQLYFNAGVYVHENLVVMLLSLKTCWHRSHKV